MTQDEYSYIIQVINENAYERKIFLGIRADLERCGFDVRQIPYEHYLRLRRERCGDGESSFEIQEESLREETVSADPPRIPEHVQDVEMKPKEPRLSQEEKRQIFGTLLLTGIMVALGIIIPSISLPIWGFAFCVLVWGLKDYIPCSGSYDSDYVQRYFRAKEDARLHTRAMIHEAYLHSGELKILNDKINGKK